MAAEPPEVLGSLTVDVVGSPVNSAPSRKYKRPYEHENPHNLQPLSKKGFSETHTELFCSRDVDDTNPTSRALHAVPMSGLMLDTEAQAEATDELVEAGAGATAPAPAEESETQASKAPNEDDTTTEGPNSAQGPAAEAPGPSVQQQVPLTIVKTTQQFQDAVVRGDAHIEVHAHLDLRNITQYDSLDQIKGLLGVLPATIQSIRGNCTEAPKTAGSWDPPLILRLPQQCLLVVSSGLLTVARSEVWLDGLYVRLGPELSIPEDSNIARTPAERALLSRPHLRRRLLRDATDATVPKQMIRVDGQDRPGWQGRLWMTSVTIQGDGVGPVADVEHGLDIISQAFAQECMFVDMDAFSLVTVETSGARGSFVDCIFARNHILAAEKQVRLGILTGRGDSPNGAAVTLEGCSFTSNNSTYNLLAQNDCKDNEGGNEGDSVFYSDDGHELTTFCKGGGAFVDKPLPVSQAAADSGFLSIDDPWFQEIQQKLPFLNRTVSQETQEAVERELVVSDAPAPGPAMLPVASSSGGIHPAFIAAINIGVTLIVAAAVAALIMMHRSRSKASQGADVTMITNQSQFTPDSSAISTNLTHRATTQGDLQPSAPDSRDSSSSASFLRLKGRWNEHRRTENSKELAGRSTNAPNLTEKQSDLTPVGSQEKLGQSSGAPQGGNQSEMMAGSAKNGPESHINGLKRSLPSVEMTRVASWDSLYGASSLGVHSTRNMGGTGHLSAASPAPDQHRPVSGSNTGGRMSRQTSHDSLSTGAHGYAKSFEKHSRHSSYETMSCAATNMSPIGTHSRHCSHDTPQGTPGRSPGAASLSPISQGYQFNDGGVLGNGNGAHGGEPLVPMSRGESIHSSANALNALVSGSPGGEVQHSPAVTTSSEGRVVEYKPAGSNLFELVPTEDSTAGLTLDGYSVTTRAPPAADAPDIDHLAYVHYQLDTLDGREVLAGLVLQEGSSCRLQGGQAVIQFATEKLNGLEYAIKFFISLETFQNEAAQYTDAGHPLRQFLPRVRDEGIVTNTDGVFVDGNGTPMPPCIVMEKGESLDVWVQRNRRVMDQFTAMQIIYHICECLMDLHGAGYVHRDLKPGNIMWLPSQNRWTLIDFGCAAKIGSQAKMGFSVMYAAPEVVRGHYREGLSTVTATTALDAWAVGVLAVEMFSGRPALKIFEGREQVIAQIAGEQELPWESEKSAKTVLRRAGKFKGPVLELLKRNPDERPSIESFVMQCSNILSSTTQQSDESGDLFGATRSTGLYHGQ